MAKVKRLAIISLASILLSGAAHAQALPNVCRTAQETNEMQDPTRSPIRADVKPNGEVTFHFKDNRPPPVTINGLEPIPNPTPGLNRNLQVYLHKKAKSEYMRCMHEEQLIKHHPERYKKYLQDRRGAPK